MAKHKIPPLKPITIKSRPLTTRAISWSCDGELVVAADDSLHVFLPHYMNSDPSEESDEDESRAAEDDKSRYEASVRPQYYSTPLRILVPKKLDPRANRRLLAKREASAELVAREGFVGCGVGVVTGFGSALNQVFAVEWSPTGVGPNLRPVLTAALTRGTILAWGETIKNDNAMTLDSKSRDFAFWKLLWGIGGVMPLPDADSPTSFSTKGDRIVSFSWAKAVAPGRGLLAYMTDTHELVVMAIQYIEVIDEWDTNWVGESTWRIDEVCRVDARGPHTTLDVHDPDYTPAGSAFSVKWGPWLSTGKDHESKTAILAYLAPNYVGFRKISLHGPWPRGKAPKVHADERDALGVCCHLAPDAFIEWEEAIWTVGDAKICRGVLATPFLVKPFEVNLNSSWLPKMATHKTSACSTTYPSETDLASTNPIVGITMHAPDLSQKSPVPIYTLVRTSATFLNDNWFQHNLPLRDSFQDSSMPRWADHIERRISAQMPEAMSYGVLDGSDSSDEDFDDLPEDAGEQVHTCRVKIWGIVGSPGSGSTAVLFSEHSTVRIDRAPQVKVAFGWTPRDEVEKVKESPLWGRLTAEGKAWEWMYGAGCEMDGFPVKEEDPRLFDLFKDVISHQVCPLCSAGLQKMGKDFVCANNHAFARCCASGLPILSPSISRVCGLCGGRNILVDELKRVAKEHHGRDILLHVSGDVCNGCGGKFVL